MDFSSRLHSIQQSLQKASWDGWLLYDFRKTNDLACRFLEIPHNKMCTRRFFYWIPARGNPIKIVHRIESHVLEHLPGESVLYSSWSELDGQLKILEGLKKIAMEYSPRNSIPYVSKVDAGTVDLVRSFGVEVVSSADLLQQYTSVWSPDQLESHLVATNVLEEAVAKAWKLIGKAVAEKKKISESDVQQFLLDEFERRGCFAEEPPICAVNAHAADPHYSPSPPTATLIKPNDFVLIDLWCKQKKPQAVYSDITKVGVVAAKPTVQQQKIFNLVKEARDAAMTLLQQRLQAGKPIMGWEVDQACRDVIEKAGFGPYFTHRTGHNIGERDHGDGANIDNFETQDRRLLLPGTCFSIEPGVYLPGEFGVRLEHDVYLEPDGCSLRTTPLQTELVLIT